MNTFFIELSYFIVDNKISIFCYLLSIITCLIIIGFKRYFITKKSREYLDMGTHCEKNIIPSMGGISFFLVLPALYYAYGMNFLHEYIFIFLSAILSALVGAVDDIYKIKYGKGLKIYPKFLFQMVVSFIPATYYYCMFPDSLFIKFLWNALPLGVGYIFWIVWVLMSTTHAVNLIDGIDGLAISQVMIITIFSPLFIIAMPSRLIVWIPFQAFASFNYYKAKLFMGDIGSFFLGGFLASMFIVAKAEVLLVVSGIIFVINTLICLIQIFSYKIIKKRFFLFTPYHHALEKKGFTENKIVLIYSIITFFSSLLSIFIYKKYYI